MKDRRSLDVGATIEWSEDLRPSAVPDNYKLLDWGFLNIQRKGTVLELKQSLVGKFKLLVLSNGELLTLTEKQIQYVA